MFTRKTIERDYAHRIAEDAKHCPVCCGSKVTTDPKYGGAVVPRNAPTTVMECLACRVWVPPVQVGDLVYSYHHAANVPVCAVWWDEGLLSPSFWRVSTPGYSAPWENYGSFRPGARTLEFEQVGNSVWRQVTR